MNIKKSFCRQRGWSFASSLIFFSSWLISIKGNWLCFNCCFTYFVQKMLPWRSELWDVFITYTSNIGLRNWDNFIANAKNVQCECFATFEYALENYKNYSVLSIKAAVYGNEMVMCHTILFHFDTWNYHRLLNLFFNTEYILPSNFLW